MTSATLYNRVEEFLAVLQVEGASASTVSAYQNDLRQLTAFFETDAKRRRARLDAVTVQSFVGDLRKRGYAHASIARKSSVIRSFSAFLHADKDTTSSNPATGLHAQTTSVKPARNVASADEIDRLLKQTVAHPYPLAKRDRAMIELICTTGIRVTELVSVKVTDLTHDRRGWNIHCQGKGAKDRMIQIPNRGVTSLIDYLADARPMLVRNETEHALFVNHFGGRLTRQGFWLILSAHAREAGLTSRFNPVTLRRSFAARMMGDGIPLPHIQRILGHATQPQPRSGPIKG